MKTIEQIRKEIKSSPLGEMCFYVPKDRKEETQSIINHYEKYFKCSFDGLFLTIKEWS